MERVYDRLVSFDERSRGYAARALIDDAAQPISREWPLLLRLNQLNEGACTGFGVTHEAGADPDPIPNLNEGIARGVYYRARELDEWEGEDYEGSSVLAAMKAGKELGWYSEYRWAFGIDDLILSLGHLGPAVLGINWYEGMEETGAYAHIRPTGRVVGGHAIVANAIDLENFGGRVKLTNSWGANWGWRGACLITVDDLERLLDEDGEAAIPVVRSSAPPVVPACACCGRPL